MINLKQLKRADSFLSSARSARGLTVNRRAHGFTLVELLIVIAILGVLASLILANMSGARERARDAQRKSDLRQLQTALRMYFTDFGRNPASTASNQIQHSATSEIFDWGDEFGIGGNTYMSKLPIDPLDESSGGAYSYNYQLHPTDTDLYCAWAVLENESDGQIATSQERCSSICSGLPTAAFVLCSD